MNDEDAFQSHLDAHPDDYTARLVFADWLDERGDPRGPGYRAMGVLRKRAQVAPRGDIERPWGFTWVTGYAESHYRATPRCIPGDWFHAAWAPGAPNTEPSRREAEDVAALAFAELPAERRAVLLDQHPHV